MLPFASPKISPLMGSISKPEGSPVALNSVGPLIVSIP